MPRTTVLLAIIALLGSVTAGFAQNVPVELDIDKDGYISAKEAEILPELTAQFKALDTDKDGKISMGELALFTGK